MDAYVAYINLDSRPDRRAYIEAELAPVLSALGLEAHRIAATRRDRGDVGCGLSHIRALTAGLKSGRKHVLVFEDDFQWECPTEEAAKNIRSLLSGEPADFNVVALSFYTGSVKCQPATVLNGVRVAEACNTQTTPGYIVQREFIKTLGCNFAEAIAGLKLNKDKDVYSIDQYWKRLQVPGNLFYTTVPRLGRQRAGASDIQKKFVCYGSTCFIVVLSCEKYESRRAVQDMSRAPVRYRYFLGDPGIAEARESGNLVYLPCADNYESLTTKVELALQWVLEKYPLTDYVFKTDDDTTINFGVFANAMYSNERNGTDYAGYPSRSSRLVGTDHQGKCSCDELNKTGIILPQKIRYFSGGGYFLSKKAIQLRLSMKAEDKYIYEDYTTGMALKDSNIKRRVINNIARLVIW